MCYYFCPVEGINVSNLMISQESLYSVTPWRDGQFISKTILNFYDPYRPVLNSANHVPSITDGTCHVGGNTISFHLNGFETVNSIDIDQSFCQMLKHNLEVYSLPSDHVYCGDYTSMYRQFKQDVVYLDPPWGGPNYLDNVMIDLYLSNHNISDICKQLLSEHVCSLVVIKVPLNFNYLGFKSVLCDYQIIKQPIYHGQRYSYNVLYTYLGLPVAGLS